MGLRRILTGSVRDVLERFGAPGPGLHTGDGIEPAEVEGVRAVCHTAWPKDPQLIEQWSQLAASHPLGSAFASPIWQQGLAERFVGAGRLRLLTVHRGAQLLGVLPLSITGGGEMESMGWSASDYLDPIFDPAHEPLAWRAVLALVERNWDQRLSSLTLKNLQASSACLRILPDIAAEYGFLADAAVLDCTLQVQLPDSWDAYLQGLDGHDRRELLRKLRKFEAEPTGRFEVVTDPAQVSSLMEQAVGLMAAGDDDKADAMRDTLRPLLSEVAAPMAGRGELAVAGLWIHGKLAAADIGISSRWGWLGYNGGYSRAFRDWNAGSTIKLLLVRRAIERGEPVFDMLRGTERYKYRLGAVERPLWRISLRPE